MGSLISKVFSKVKSENRPALLTYTVAGDNTKKKSLEILKSISEHVDILEIGMPFNAPTADGSQIQNSSYRALKNGIKLKDVFQIVKDYKKVKMQSLVFLWDTIKWSIDMGRESLLKNVNKLV